MRQQGCTGVKYKLSEMKAQTRLKNTCIFCELFQLKSYKSGMRGGGELTLLGSSNKRKATLQLRLKY